MEFVVRHRVTGWRSVGPLALVLLAGCGGAGDAGGTGNTTGPTGPSTQAKFASYRRLYPPLTVGAFAGKMMATNTGLYVLYPSADARSDNTVARFESGGSDINGWTSYSMRAGVPWLSNFAPVSLTNERPGTFSAYIIEQSDNRVTGTNTKEVTMYSVNSGAPPARWVNDIRAAVIVPSADESESRRLAWALTEEDGIYRETGQVRGGANTLTNAGWAKVSNVAGYLGAAHPKTGSLWVAGGDKLYEIAPSGATLRTIAVGGLGVWYMKFVGTTLYLAAGADVMRMGDDGQLRRVGATMGSFSFCVQGGMLYTIDGVRTNLLTGATDSWFVDRPVPQLSPSDVTKLTEVITTLSGMLECAPEGHVMYVNSAKGLYEVTPP